MRKTDEFNTEVFLSLPEVKQQKVEKIYEIAENLHDLKAKPLSVEEFDKLYDRDLSEIIEIYNNLHDINKRRVAYQDDRNGE